MAAFLKDRRGAVAIQVVLLLPILIIIIIGAYEVWKILYVRQTLNDAAYQAVRLLVLQPYEWDTFTSTNVQAENLVRRYVDSNRFIDPADLTVNVTMDSVLPVCGKEIRVDITLDWVIGENWGRHQWIPFLGRSYQMTVRAAGPIMGGQRVWP